MTKFVPRRKMSKKTRKQADAENRVIWAFSPVTRKIESKKVYDRKRISRAGYEDGSGVFIIFNMILRLWLTANEDLTILKHFRETVLQQE